MESQNPAGKEPVAASLRPSSRGQDYLYATIGAIAEGHYTEF